MTGQQAPIISAVQPGRASSDSIWAFIAMSGCLLLFAGIVLFAQSPGTPGVLLFAVFASAWAGASISALTQATVLLELTATELRWRTPLRSGVIPLDQIIAIRWKTLGRSSSQNYTPAWNIRIEVRNGKRLQFVSNPDMAAFTDEIKAAALQVKVKLPPVIAWARAGYRGPFRDPWV